MQLPGEISEWTLLDLGYGYRCIPRNNSTKNGLLDTSHHGAPTAVDIAESASRAIDTLVGMLDDGVSPPPSLLALKQAIESGESETIAKALYELLVEQTLDFDMSEERKLVETKVDYSQTDNALVREKMLYVYTCVSPPHVERALRHA
eukprot:6196868-Pleurochrysis_carterae.AAC.1